MGVSVNISVDIVCYHPNNARLYCACWGVRDLGLNISFAFLNASKGSHKLLDLRPNCECCDRDLLPDTLDAMICTYECTFCRKCVHEVLRNVCPNCGGGFVSRPIRPKVARRKGVSISHQPASTERVHTRYTREELAEFASQYEHVFPKDR